MSLRETIKGLTNPFHAYIFGTAFWYALRGAARLIAPATVANWFRPPVQWHLAELGAEPNDLELYTIRNDAWGLITISLLLLALADAVPLPKSLTGSSLIPGFSTSRETSAAKKPYARAVILITMFHHVATAVGAYQHWKLESHYTPAFDIGVFGNVFFTGLGVAALMWGLKGDEGHVVGKRRV